MKRIIEKLPMAIGIGGLLIVLGRSDLAAFFLMIVVCVVVLRDGE